MSASEKLKELGEHEVRGIGVLQRQVEETLYDFLPQIVAVVEAAENVTFYGQEAHRYNEWHGSQIVAALAALEEAL